MKVRIKTLFVLAVAVLITFAVSGCSLYGPLGGRAVICPYIIKDDPNQTTVVSISVPTAYNAVGSTAYNAAAAELHYVYLYKDMDAADTDACEEYDFKGATSPNDLVSFDVGGMFGDAAGEEGLPLFNDTTSDPLMAGSTLALTVGPSIGYLLVELLDKDNQPIPAGEGLSPNAEVLILDIANGGGWGYRCGSGGTQLPEAILFYGGTANTIVHPPAIVNTEFMITPMSFGMLTSGGYDSAILKGQTAVIQPINNITLDLGEEVSGSPQIYDRNENTLSSTKEKKVKCVGVATLNEFLSSGIINNPAFMAQGGWSFLWNKPFAGTGTESSSFKDTYNDAWIYKVESSSGLGSFMINAMPNGGISVGLLDDIIPNGGIGVQ